VSTPKRTNPILERNLTQLLQRSWKPQAPQQAFGERLDSLLRQRIMASYGSTRRSAESPPQHWRRVLLGAAALLLVAGLLRSLIQNPTEPVSDPSAVVVAPANIDLQSETIDDAHESSDEREAVANADISNPALETLQDTQPVEVHAAEGSIEVLARDGVTGDVITNFTTWLRLEVALPEVSDAERHIAQSEGGHLRIDGIAPGHYRICLEAESYHSIRLPSQRVEAGGLLSLSVDFFEGGSVSGYVVDRDTGAPLANAILIAELDQPHSILPISKLEGDLGSIPTASARTDASGAFRLPQLSPGRHHLRASLDGYAPTWTSKFDTESGEESILATIELGPGSTIQGRVEREDGSPWAAAEVIASHMTMTRSSPCLSYGRAIADSDGSYRIDDLPAGFYVVIHSDERRSPSATTNPIQRRVVAPETLRMVQVDLRAETIEEANFLGAARGAGIEGRLLDMNGHAMPGMRLSLNPIDDQDAFHSWRAVVCDAEGRFELKNLESGTFGVFAGHDFKSHMARIHTLHIEAGEKRHMDFRLTGTAIEGVATVLRGSNPNHSDSTDNSLQDIEILALLHQGGKTTYAGRTQILATGQWSFEGLEPGPYYFLARDTEGEWAMQISSLIELRDGGLASWSPSFQRAGALLIRVVDEAGNPVANAPLSIRSDDGFVVRSMQMHASNDAGIYLQSGLAPGMWTVSAAPPGFHPSSARESAMADDQASVRIVLSRL
jgi:protocatechuate 3,4-dioxygenase beta subunit